MPHYIGLPVRYYHQHSASTCRQGATARQNEAPQTRCGAPMTALISGHDGNIAATHMKNGEKAPAIVAAGVANSADGRNYNRE